MTWIKGLIGSVLGCIALLWAVGYMLFHQGEHRYLPVTVEQQAEAKAYAANALAPMPEGWVFDQFKAREDLTLEVGYLEAPNAKATILIVPGYTAPIDVYGYASRRFYDAGFNVAAISYEGQGRSPRPLEDPEKGHVVSYGALAGDVAAFTRHLKERFRAPVMVFGNSKGGHISLRMAGDFAPDVKAYGLMVPMVKIYTGSFPYWVAEGLSHFYTALGMGEFYAAGQKQWQTSRLKWDQPTNCNRRADKAHGRDSLFALEEKLRVEGTTFQWVASTTRSTKLLQSEAYREKLDKPFLFVTAGKDLIVDTPAASALCKKLNQCTEVVFEEAMHCIDREKDEDRDKIFDIFIQHFEANL